MAITILLADDSVPAQNTGRKILTEAGYDVVTASNGLEALRKLNEAAPALAILDIFMPGYTGLEICQKLRSVPATAALPVILTVGKLEPFREGDAIKVGANATLVKPFVTEQMLKAVHSLLGVPVPEVKAAPPLQPPPASAGEDEPIFAYTAANQELLEKGSSVYGSPAEALQGGSGHFLFNPDASHTPFSASSVDLVTEEPQHTETPTGAESFVVPPADLELTQDVPAVNEKVEAGSLLPKEYEDPSVASAGLDPLLELGQHESPPNILETSVLEVGELPAHLTTPGFAPEPISASPAPPTSKPVEEEHLSSEEQARRKAFEDLFNSTELPPVEELLAAHSDESLELLPNLSRPDVGYEPHISADPELEQLDPTRQPAVHPEALVDPYLEKHVTGVEDILPQVAAGAGRDVYLEDSEGGKPFVSGAPLETLTSSGTTNAGLQSEVAEHTHTALPADEKHLDPLEKAPEKVVDAAKVSVPEHSGLAHELLSKAVEAVEAHAGHSPLISAAAGLAGGAGIAAAVPILEHLAGALTHNDPAKPETSAAVPQATESASPLEAVIHHAEALNPLAESATPGAMTEEVVEHNADAAHAKEEARQPLATDGPLAAVFEMAKHDFTHASQPIAHEAEALTDAVPPKHEAEAPAVESAAKVVEHAPDEHEEEARKAADKVEADPLNTQNSQPDAALNHQVHVAADGAGADDDAEPLEVHSVEAEHLQAAVEKVFERFKPLLVAAIVRELARRD